MSTTIEKSPAVFVPPWGVAERHRRSSDVGTIRIPLNSRKYPGLFALIDEEDYEIVAPYSWCPAKPSNGSHQRNTFYAQAPLPIGGGRFTTLRLHRVILGLNARDPLVDHINGDGLDCRRANLRLADHKLNGANRAVPFKSKSGYKGVYWHRSQRGWKASITVDGRTIHLGGFASPEDAARAYDIAAEEAFGEYARLNFPKEKSA